MSLAGVMPLAWSADKIGPLARDARDCALVLRAIAGRDGADPRTCEWTFRGPERRRTLRIGVLDTGLADAPAAAALFDDALTALRQLGHRLRPARLPSHDYTAIFGEILAAETADAHAELIASERTTLLTDPLQADGLRALRERPLLPYVRAARERALLIPRVREALAAHDVLVAPTTLTEAIPIDADVRRYRGARRGGHMHVGALVGTPELTAPMGFGPHGLPIGISFMGDRFREPVLLTAAIDYQRETEWHRRRPPDPDRPSSA